MRRGQRKLPFLLLVALTVSKISLFFRLLSVMIFLSSRRAGCSNLPSLFFSSASVFAYGQTSSGKTYTMRGITEYTVADIYDYIQRVTKALVYCYFESLGQLG